MLHTNDKIVKHKDGLLNLADEVGNIAQACKTKGDTGQSQSAY